MNHIELIRIALKAYLAEQRKHSDPLASTARQQSFIAALTAIAPGLEPDVCMAGSPAVLGIYGDPQCFCWPLAAQEVMA